FRNDIIGTESFPLAGGSTRAIFVSIGLAFTAPQDAAWSVDDVITGRRVTTRNNILVQWCVFFDNSLTHQIINGGVVRQIVNFFVYVDPTFVLKQLECGGCCN